MIRRVKLTVESDEEGNFIVLPPEWDFDFSNAVWVIEGGKYEIHLDGQKYRRDAWYQALNKLEVELGWLPDQDWQELCRLMREPKK